MKILVALAVYVLPLVLGARLGARQQDTCNGNDCYIAVWGPSTSLVPPDGLIGCANHLTTTLIIYPL
jgi:hypothetical protein